MRRYTMQDWQRLKDLYARNWELLIEAVPGSPTHIHYVNRERRIDRLQTKIGHKKRDKTNKRGLDILAKDPCMIGHAKSCHDCTGYYTARMVMTPRGQRIKSNVMVTERLEDERVFECRLHPRNLDSKPQEARGITKEDLKRGYL